MDSWLVEIIKIVLGALIGVVIAEAFPTIKTYMKRVPLSYKAKRIKLIKERYFQIQGFKNNQAALTIEVLRLLTTRLLSGFVFLFFFLVLIYVRVANPELSTPINTTSNIFAAWLGIISSNFNDIGNLISNVNEFDKFEERTIKKLKKLIVPKKIKDELIKTNGFVDLPYETVLDAVYEQIAKNEYFGEEEVDDKHNKLIRYIAVEFLREFQD